MLYIAAEDPTDIETRMRALAKRHGRTPNLSVGNKYCQLTDPEHLKRVVARVDKYRPKLIVIDLLAAAFPGIDREQLERQHDEHRGYVVRRSRRLCHQQQARPCIVVHHCAKGGTTPRGSGVAHTGHDCQMGMRLERAGKGLIATALTKNRNGSSDQRLERYPHRPGRPWHG